MNAASTGKVAGLGGRTEVCVARGACRPVRHRAKERTPEPTHPLAGVKLLGLRALGLICKADGVLFYLTARGTGCARGFLQKYMREQIYKCNLQMETEIVANATKNNDCFTWNIFVTSRKCPRGASGAHLQMETAIYKCK